MINRSIARAASVLGIFLALSIPPELSAFTTWFAPFGSQYLPAILYANPNLNDECGNYGAFIRGARAWNQVSCSDFRFGAGGIVSRYAPADDDFQVVRWTNNCDPGVLATTYLLTNGPDRECDVLFCRNWNWNCGPGSSTFTQFDLQGVATHEFGHVLGLGHSSVSTATMYYAVGYGDDSRRTLHQDDMDGLCSLYD